jgi:N-acetylglucosamine-6-sulfatase
MTFRNAFVSNAICCPSRATIMRGQYSHNSGVWSNSDTISGGWQAYQQNGNEADNVATRLHDAGYRTGLFGKYLNGYADTTTYVPQKWDRWFATQGAYFNYDANDNGTIRHFGTNDGDYQTDVLSRKTNSFISNSAAQGKPFFAYVAPKAPHLPAIPAPRDAHDYDGIQGPRPPSFDEADVSDKPSWIQHLPRLTTYQISQIDKRHENRVESLQAVDDLVQGVVGKLKNANALDDTYIFFTSDNGWHHGEHRVPKGKWRPYEEDVHMPLLVRGPGVAAGSATYAQALNTDYLPTFTDLAGVSPPPYVDGRSLEPVLNGGASGWRSAILLEVPQHSTTPASYGIRTSNEKYIEYSNAAKTKELYRLNGDPYELANTYNAAKPQSGLASRLQVLEGCAGDACREAEDGP